MEESEQINFVIDEYQDLFSDFDSRSYDKKSLSDDFLKECRKASVDKKFEGIELQILLPKKIKNEKKEDTIKDRLKNHFIKHYEMAQKERYKIIRLGLILLFFAILDLAVSTFAHYLLENQNELLLSLFYVVFDPLGILLLWEGVGRILFEPKKMKPELDFYKKMSKAKIVFETLKDESLLNHGSKVI